MKIWMALAALIITIVIVTGLRVSDPGPVANTQFGQLTGDITNGKQVFLASGCGSCHMAPNSTDKITLSGGQSFASPFGVFLAPNISPHPTTGIGAWTLPQFATAVTRGVSPNGQHYFPAFPYTAYIKMRDQDVADLWVYLATLPPSATPSRPHQLSFPFNNRRSVGIWKALFFDDEWVLQGDLSPLVERGRYLVEAQGHCAECHTPRGLLGQLLKNQWLAGGPDPTGSSGTIPALTKDQLNWSVEDISYYLETGFTPDYDSVGGHMAAVVDNFSQLTAEDRHAVASYIAAYSAQKAEP
jgi:mono/diheme cytochrome c family protein